jgi:sugar lactone lactonase YvrE
MIRPSTDNGKTIVAFDALPDGTTKIKDLVTLEGGANGDGMCIDSEGRLYVTAGDNGYSGIRREGKQLGVPLPRSASAAHFPDPIRRCLGRAGMTGPDGKSTGLLWCAE